jgi:hypothetical protein
MNFIVLREQKQADGTPVKFQRDEWVPYHLLKYSESTCWGEITGSLAAATPEKN